MRDVLPTRVGDGAQVSGTARYSRRGNKEEVHLSEPAQSATLSLQQVSLRLSDAQLHAAQSLAEVRLRHSAVGVLAEGGA